MTRKDLLKKENDIVTGYKFYKTHFDKKENLISLKPVEFNLFKCVANHKDFATLVQNLVTSRELITLNSKIATLEKKQLQEFTLSENDENKLKEYRLKKQLADSFKESLIEDIPVSYKDKKITEYPPIVILLANWIDNIIPKFPVDKIKTLINKTISNLVDNGKIEIDDSFCKEVADLLKDFYSKMYSTNKDSIFKKWILKFDLVGIRKMLLACGLDAKVVNGEFTYTMKSTEECQLIVAHALLRRMQKDNAEVDDKTTEKKVGGVTRTKDTNEKTNKQ